MMKKHIISTIIAFFIIFSGTTAFGETITLATLNWAPFYGEKLPENGFFAALSREAFKRAGYDMKLKFMPWNRALEMSKTGKFDGLLGAYYSEEREEHFVFTVPVSQNQESFFQKKGGNISFSTLDDLKSYKIGGLLGGAPTKELKAKGFKVEGTANELTSVKKVNAGRLDLLIMGKQNLYYAMSNDPEYKAFKDALDVIEPPFKSYDLYCPITKKRPDAKTIADKFNAALEQMKADGTYDAILARFGQK